MDSDNRFEMSDVTEIYNDALNMHTVVEFRDGACYCSCQREEI